MINKKFNRDAAFSMDLSDPSLEGGNRIHSSFEINGRLFVFSTHSIAEILTAASIDPAGKEPETRHSHQKLHDIGTSNSIIARTIIQSKELLDVASLRNDLSKSQLLKSVWEITELLLDCENSHHSIYSETTDLMHQCDSIIEKAKLGRTIPSLPQVQELESRVSTYLTSAKRFLEKTHLLLCSYYEAPVSGSNFQKYREWMKSNHPDKTEINSLLESDQEWIKCLAYMRNALPTIHYTSGNSVDIENFKIQPGNQFSLPRWKHDFSTKGGPIQEDWSDITIDMSNYTTNLLTFFEELFFLSLRDSLDSKLKIKFEIFKRTEKQINPDCPTVYFIAPTNLPLK